MVMASDTPTVLNCHASICCFSTAALMIRPNSSTGRPCQLSALVCVLGPSTHGVCLCPSLATRPSRGGGRLTCTDSPPTRPWRCRRAARSPSCPGWARRRRTAWPTGTRRLVSPDTTRHGYTSWGPGRTHPGSGKVVPARQVGRPPVQAPARREALELHVVARRLRVGAGGRAAAAGACHGCYLCCYLCVKTGRAGWNCGCRDERGWRTCRPL